MSVWRAKSAEFKRLWGYSIGFYSIWIAHIGRRLGLFEQISKKPCSPKELAAILTFDTFAVESWCSAALAAGFLKISKARKGLLYLTPEMKSILLDKASSNYLGGQFSYLALRSLSYGSFDDLMKKGKTEEMTSTFDAIVQATEWDHNAFLSAIRNGKKGRGVSTYNNKIHLMLSTGCRVLDVGCGTGTFMKKLSLEYPLSSFTGIEPSIEAHESIRLHNDQFLDVRLQAGEEMKFENEFDLVYLGESLYAAFDKQAIVTNCFRALRKDGVIAIVEGLLPTVTLNDENRLIMEMQIDFSLQGFRFMNKNEIIGLLKTAGFVNIAFEDFGGALFLITANRP